MKTNLNILFTMFTVLMIQIIGTVNNSYSQNEFVDIKLKSHFNVIYCESKLPKTEVLITIGMGEIKSKDSLYGFNFIVKYDQEKIKFNSKIFINTISEFAEFKDLTFNIEPGKIMGYALNSYPFTGNRELMGFYGEYTGNLCDDSTLFEIETIEFTDEYKKQIRNIEGLCIKPEKYEYSDYNINSKFNESIIKYDFTRDNIISSQINIDNNIYFDKLRYKLTMNDGDYTIASISSSNNNLVLANINNDGKIAEFDVISEYDKIKGNLNFVDVKIIKKSDVTDTNATLIIEPLELSNCNCVKSEKISGDKIRLFYINPKDTVTSVDEENSNYLDLKYVNNTIILNTSDNILINSMQLFNYNGLEILNIKNSKRYNNISKEISLSNGVYYAVIYTDREILKKIVLVYN